MGLLKNKETKKVKKIEKYEEYPDQSPSKHHPKKFSGVIVRPMPQPSIMGNNINPYQLNFGYSPYSANISSYKSPFLSNSPYDLSRYPGLSIPINPYGGMQPGRTIFPPIWSNGMIPFGADRSPRQ